MGGSRHSTFLLASDLVFVAKNSSLIQIWGAGAKAALCLILPGPTHELAPFVPEVASASPAEKRQISRDSDRISRQAVKDY